jgi:aconitate hydratase
MEDVYEKMEAALAVVRRRLGRPLTLAEKILFGHLDDPSSPFEEEPYLVVRPDRVVFQDVLGQTAMLQFMQTKRERVAVPTSIHCDHLIEARDGALADLRRSKEENHEVYDFLRSAAAKFGASFWEPGAGIVHQVVLENYAAPGLLLLGTDSHTPNAGGLGACAVGVGGAEAVEAIAGLPWEVLRPKRFAVFLTGALGGWTAPKDVILHVAGKLGVRGGTHAIIEYIGPGARTISATGKATITNMGAELGATTSMFPVDEKILRYLRATNRGELVPIIARHWALFEPDPDVEADPSRHYDRVIEIDLSKLEPHVVGPHTPDRARPISALASEPGIAFEISTALVGSCTNSSYEDMTRAADVAAQALAHGLRAKSQFFVTPGSERVRATIDRDGQLARLSELGAITLANACGPCIGQWRPADAGDGERTIVTSYNRNFPGRNDGRASTMAFIASPEIVTAFAIAGRLSFNPLTDSLTGADGAPFRLSPPGPASDVPERAFERGAACIDPPADGTGVALRIDPASTRLQALAPWPAWDGKDFLDMPILMKTRGKTTTDQISPAGPWLRYRGHLERFSDNFLSGAIDAFTGTTRRVADVAREHRARGVRWIVVGDDNYGEGSSREHAALSVRMLGGVAVVARSFARIHESNLKKQGVLALTFEDRSDYDRLRADDRVSIVDIAELAPGRPVLCRVLHADGTVDTIRLLHSYAASQLAWFRAGSALNTRG